MVRSYELAAPFHALFNPDPLSRSSVILLKTHGGRQPRLHRCRPLDGPAPDKLQWLYTYSNLRKLGHDRVVILSLAAAYVKTTTYDTGSLAVFPEYRPVKILPDERPGFLEQLGEMAVGSLKRALATSPSLEARRRIESLIEKLETMPVAAATLREIRAVEALETIASPSARKLLQELARGAMDARLTQEAQESLARMYRLGR